MLVVGVGNAYRCDDAAGLAVIELLRDRLPAYVLKTSDGEPSSLLELLASHDRVIIVDAARADAEPGTVFSYDARRWAAPPAGLGSSTHVVDVGEIVELARALDQLPSELAILAVVGEDFAHGQALSPRVRQAIPRLADEIEKRVRPLL